MRVEVRAEPHPDVQRVSELMGQLDREEGPPRTLGNISRLELSTQWGRSALENKCPALLYQGGGEGGTHTSSCQRRESRGPSLTDYTLSQDPPKECALPKVSQKWKELPPVERFSGEVVSPRGILQRSWSIGGTHGRNSILSAKTLREKSWQAQKGVKEKLDIAPRGGGVRPQFYSWAKFQECMGFYCTLRTKLCCFQGGWICQHFLVHLWLLTSMALQKTKGRYWDCQGNFILSGDGIL